MLHIYVASSCQDCKKNNCVCSAMNKNNLKKLLNDDLVYDLPEKYTNENKPDDLNSSCIENDSENDSENDDENNLQTFGFKESLIKPNHYHTHPHYKHMKKNKQPDGLETKRIIKIINEESEKNKENH